MICLLLVRMYHWNRTCCLITQTCNMQEITNENWKYGESLWLRSMMWNYFDHDIIMMKSNQMLCMDDLGTSNKQSSKKIHFCNHYQYIYATISKVTLIVTFMYYWNRSEIELTNSKTSVSQLALSRDHFICMYHWKTGSGLGTNHSDSGS